LRENPKPFLKQYSQQGQVEDLWKIDLYLTMTKTAMDCIE